MTTTNMTLSALVSSNASLATIVEALTKGTKYEHSFDGAMGIITKYWNKGFGECAKALGYDSPKALRKFVLACKNAAEKGQTIEGMDSRMVYSSEDSKGNVSTCLGTWGTKNLEGTETTKDKKGKETKMYVMVGETVAQIDVLKAMTNVTPSTIFTFVIQNQELLAGNVCPQTDEAKAIEIAKQVEEERIAKKNAKTAKKTAPKAPTAKAPKSKAA